MHTNVSITSTVSRSYKFDVHYVSIASFTVKTFKETLKKKKKLFVSAGYN